MNWRKTLVLVVFCFVFLSLTFVLEKQQLAPEYINKHIEGAPGVTGGVSMMLMVVGEAVPPNLTVVVKNLGGYENGTTFLNWTQDHPELVYNYLLYATDSYSTGFDFNTPYKVFDGSTRNFTDTDASLVEHRFYILRANSTTDIIESNNNTWGMMSIIINNTYAGGDLNLKSLPFFQLETAIDKTIIQNDTNYKITQVYLRNDILGNSPIADYYTDYGWYWENPVFDNGLDTPRGMWLKSKDNLTMHVAGFMPKENITIPVYKNDNNGGLNLIGWRSALSKTFSDAVAQTDANYYIYQIYDRNATSGSYAIADYYTDWGWYSENDAATHFEPGRGYWVKTIRDENWTCKMNE